MDKPVTEQELKENAQVKGGERVTLEDVESAIVHEVYFTAEQGKAGACGHETHAEILKQFPEIETSVYKSSCTREFFEEDRGPLSRLTLCVLTLWNGFTVLGQSACADPKSFDPEIGRRLARAHAVNQIWPLMGYELRSRMARDQRLLGGSPVDAKLGRSYIGTKAINAWPTTRGAYNALRGWKLPDNEDGDDEGYLVEYLDQVQDPPHVNGFKGYVSWSPKDVFERSYRKVELAR